MSVKDVERIGSPQITKANARTAFLDYRRAVTRETDAQRRKEYEGLMRGYRAIAAGAQVLDLQQTMKAAGLQHDTWYPKLAICRADARKCRVEMYGNGAARFNADYNTEAKTRTVRMPSGTFETYTVKWSDAGRMRDGRVWSDSATAIVPLVPAHLHPRHQLLNYHILWDAVWTPDPPSDPLLLKHLAGHLYAIVAQWDLTPLERAVLRGRL